MFMLTQFEVTQQSVSVSIVARVGFVVFVYHQTRALGLVPGPGNGGDPQKPHPHTQTRHERVFQYCARLDWKHKREVPELQWKIATTLREGTGIGGYLLEGRYVWICRVWRGDCMCS